MTGETKGGRSLTTPRTDREWRPTDALAKGRQPRTPGEPVQSPADVRAWAPATPGVVQEVKPKVPAGE